jgi:glutathione S-transferase
MSEQKLELISFEICPFVERSRIVLEEKGRDYELTFIDLDDKPDWFLEISPRGKVPVLRVDGEPVFESMVINEMLEELFAEPKMFPDDTVERAQARSWIVYCNDVVMSAAATIWFSERGDEGVDDAREELREALGRLEDELASREEGPYFQGATFGLVDAVYAPVFNRWEVCEKLGHGDLLADFPRVVEYAEAVTARPSVLRARYDDLIDEMMEYRREHLEEEV